MNSIMKLQNSLFFILIKFSVLFALLDPLLILSIKDLSGIPFKGLRSCQNKTKNNKKQ